MCSIIKYVFFLFLLCATPALAFAQEHFTISGYVTDSSNSARLMGANVRVLPVSRQGTFSNDYGFYSITLKGGAIALACSYVGYKADTVHFYLKEDTTIHFHLSDLSSLKMVTVSSRIPIEQRSDISHISIPVKELAAIPSLMGEKDMIKAIQLLPGVQTGNDGSTGLYVRGGGPGQNLILLDGVPVYNVSHLFGFFSVFTPEAIQSVDLYKGGFPARYGGRLSSVLDVRMKEGNMKKLRGDVAIGLLSGKFSLEGPIKKNKSSFLISARRTFLDILLKPVFNAAIRSNGDKGTAGYYFGDFTAKINDIINDKNRLYLSFYGGNDKFYGKIKQTEEAGGSTSRTRIKGGLGWGNITGALRWNKTISPKLFSNLSLSYTRFRYLLSGTSKQNETEKPDNEIYKYEYRSDIRDWAAKLDFDYAPSPTHAVKFGAAVIFHRFQPGVSIGQNGGDSTLATSRDRQGSPPIFSKKYALYAEDEIVFTDRLKTNIGLRFSMYNVENHLYVALQPRFSGRYLLGNSWSLKAGYARMFQPLHLLVNSGAGLPTDLWVPATAQIPPEYSNQYTLGVAKTFKEQYEFTAEAYYKTMNQVIAYKDGANFSNTHINWQDKVNIGKGEAYGLELFLRKTMGKTTGWISYTLAFNTRKFPDINDGQTFPYKYDRRHDVKLVLMHKFSKHFHASLNWVYASGNTITLPVSKYKAPYNGINYNFPYPIFSSYNSKSDYVEYIPSRNNYRMRAYHRLDVSLDFIKQKKHGVRTWNISVYNLYSRKNPYFYYYQKDRFDNPRLKQFSLLPIVPSVTYRFQFK